MARLRSLAVVLLVAVSLGQATATDSKPNIAGPEYVFELKQNGSTCFYASFKLDFTLTYSSVNASNVSDINVMSTQIHLPNNTQANVSGDCDDSNETFLSLDWKDGIDFKAVFVFTVQNDSWYLNEVSLSFIMSNSTLFINPVDDGNMTFITEVGSLFNRTFSTSEYIYCERCKTYNFTECADDSVDTCNPCPMTTTTTNETMCSSIDVVQSIMFPGDIATDNASRKLCLEDYIALQETIVPIVVGGLLAILLVLIFIAYIIAYIRRKSKDGKYERIGDSN